MHESALIPLTSQQVLEWVEDINTIFGKTLKKEIKVKLAHGRKLCVIVSSACFLTFKARKMMV